MKNIVHRDVEKFWNLRQKILSRPKCIFRYFWLRKMYAIERKYNCSIPLETTFDDSVGGACFPHGLMGIFISKGSKIGKGCTIFQQVTIGSNFIEGSKRKGCPVIGDNVFIGANSTIIGGIKIGSGVRIGAGCVVADDIPDNVTCVCAKPRIFLHQQTENEFVGYNSIK